MFMKPKFCFDHKNEYMVNIKKKHILCPCHYLSHSQKQNILNVKLKNQQNVMNVLSQLVII